MVGFGANAYRSVGLQTQVASADPHKLITMLYDGALDGMKKALVAMEHGEIQIKCQGISKACKIVNDGLKASLDRDVDPVLTRRLSLIYDYVVMRLIEANIQNNPDLIKEAMKLISDLRDTWVQIEDQVKHMSVEMHAVPSAATQSAGARGW